MWQRVKKHCELRRVSRNSLSSCVVVLGALVVLCGLVGAPKLLANAIKLQPEGREKFFWSGEQFVITCQNHNNIKNVKIRWLGPSGAFITEDRSQRIHAESNGVHASRLVVMNATAGQDEGQYKCTIGSTDDRQPRETTEFVLRLLQTTSFKETPSNLVMAAGTQPALIQCQVEFDSNVLSGTVNWYRDNVPIDMLNDSAFQVVEFEPSRQTSQLQISPLRRDHEGVYQCKAMAVTSKLSKISQHDIRLEVNYAPSFEQQRRQTIWVESGRSLASRQEHSRQTAPGNQAEFGRTRGRKGHPKHHQSYANQQQDGGALGANEQQAAANALALNQSVRVELRCECQANPPASIMWSSSSSKYVIERGEPEFVLEQPTQEINGHNTSSLLVIQYNLDPNWPHRHEQYTCSATNKLGKDTKTYTIEQGDPPPAFNVAPKGKQYNAQTSLFSFTLLGPNLDPDSQQQVFQSQELHEIVPPVDSFRIRAELPGPSQSQSQSIGATSSSSSTSHQAAHHQMLSNSFEMSKSNYAKRQSEPSVTWPVPVASSDGTNSNGGGQYPIGSKPQNFTVNLDKLPSGQQRLFLEAHNAVGWSPNATYLGDYYIVSSAYSALFTHPILLFASPILASSYLLISSLSNLIVHNNYNNFQHVKRKH